MLLELLFNDWFIVWLRTNWKNPLNPPKPENIYNLPASEVKRLIEFLAGRPVVKCLDNKKPDFEYHNLKLRALDIWNTKALKSVKKYLDSK